ncbi:MAG: fused MFS/spermidine synthase [Pseudorhodoplanes sp.]
MTSELSTGTAPSPDSARLITLLATFGTAIFVSAALLFAVQPMFTKMVLPQLGGAAAVWSVALVFFQTALLAGYVYAHLITRLAPGRMSLIIHIAVNAVACFFLPLHIAKSFGPPPQSGEAFWLLALFALSIGLPFFALAANGPLLQAWFARTSHPAAKDPYFLYAASNAGSFLALIAYPIAIEPFIRLGLQSWLWTGGFYAMILLIAACGLMMLRYPGQAVVDQSAGLEDANPPGLTDIVWWVFLAAVPSGLLIAVTAHIATDVAAVPLLWVLPLALYLVTFVIVFQTRPVIPHALVVKVQPLFVLALAAAFVLGPVESIVGSILLHLSVFFVCVLMCHGELARRRPPPRYLTGYYMWISIGGMIGGILTGLVAPHLFNWIAEYPLLLLFAVLCRPGLSLPAQGTGQYALFAALGVGLLVLAAALAFDLRPEWSVLYVVVGLLIGLTVRYWQAPLPFAAILAVLFIVNLSFRESQTIHVVRNFFGVLSVVDSQDGQYRGLWHGTTSQGTQKVRDEDGNRISGRPEMISEFFEGAGIDQVFKALHARTKGPIDYAVVGLGTGSLACQRRPGDTLTYYEIDPDIVRIASDPKLFNFVSECAPDAPVIVGDARQKLANAPDGRYDLIMIDAFIGAAIPVHLLTSEAVALYLRKLKPGGIIAMHISNKNLELASVVAGVADANGLIARIYNGGDVEEDADRYLWVPRVAVLARRDEDFGALARSDYWPVHERDRAQRVWSDDYSNVVGALIRHLRARWQQN